MVTADIDVKRVFRFGNKDAEGNAHMKPLLGGKRHPSSNDFF